ncbi:Uncharacterized protein TCM_027011 [Theobroma cacao]|uniref:Uncharacterized protein n=1 Tax=Theobroma cacao TaxID=3641 RepID=A0A061G701_THECC|nr:Uncharacterized protein TCM_027011 [Theobroma cacao]
MRGWGGRDKSPKIIRRKIRKEVSGGMQALFWRSGLMTGKFRQVRKNPEVVTSYPIDQGFMNWIQLQMLSVKLVWKWFSNLVLESAQCIPCLITQDIIHLGQFSLDCLNFIYSFTGNHLSFYCGHYGLWLISSDGPLVHSTWSSFVHFKSAPLACVLILTVTNYTISPKYTIVYAALEWTLPRKSANTRNKANERCKLLCFVDLVYINHQMKIIFSSLPWSLAGLEIRYTQVDLPLKNYFHISSAAKMLYLANILELVIF